jgi:hypothetical protein
MKEEALWIASRWAQFSLVCDRTFLSAVFSCDFSSSLLARNYRLRMCSSFETDLETEWEFAANPITDTSVKHYPGQKGYTRHDPSTGEAYPGREPKEVAELMLRTDCKKAGLMEVETIGLRLYTGPAVSSCLGFCSVDAESALRLTLCIQHAVHAAQRLPARRPLPKGQETL